jgi:hypothetical protein
MRLVVVHENETNNLHYVFLYDTAMQLMDDEIELLLEESGIPTKNMYICEPNDIKITKITKEQIEKILQ